MERLVKSGAGWRLGWEPDAPEFKGLVGGEDWAIELTEAELNDFCRLLGQLDATMTYMAGELMDQEKIACEVESDLLWLEAEGLPHAYSLHLILHKGRRAEGHWPPPAVPSLVQTAQVLKIF